MNKEITEKLSNQGYAILTFSKGGADPLSQIIEIGHLVYKVDTIEEFNNRIKEYVFREMGLDLDSKILNYISNASPEEIIKFQKLANLNYHKKKVEELERQISE